MARPSRTGGKKSEAKARDAGPAKGRKTAKPKRHIVPATTRVKRRSVSGSGTDLKEAREQQAATAEILKVIASSPDDVQPVFEAIASSANRLIGGFSTAVMRYDGDAVHLAAFTPTDEAGDEALKAFFPRSLDEDALHLQALRNGRVVQIPDTETYPQTSRREMARKRGFRSQLLVPLMSHGAAIGHISVTRVQTGSFADHHVQLLHTFADQAVIAIENARLFNEVQARTRDLTESLEQQTATSDVLKVISSSPGELEPVFQTMLSNATRICEAKFGMMYRFDNGQFHPAALLNVPPALAEFVRDRGSFLPPPGTPLDRLFRTKEVTYTADETAESNPGAPARLGGARSLVGVPMLKENELIGAIIIYRQEVRPFTDKQVELVTSFANQAIIAIENTRLLKELRERTDNLSESLQHQTGTAEVLKVICGSPGKIEPVFDKILASARQLCDAKFGHLLLFDGETWRAEALHNVPKAYARFWHANPVVAAPETNLGRVQRSGKPDQVADVRLAGGYLARSPLAVATVELGGARTLLTVPLLKEGKVIGCIAFFRTEVRPFDGKQV